MKDTRNQYSLEIIKQLRVGQSIYLAPEDSKDLHSSQIVLEEYGIERIPKTGRSIKIVDAGGKMRSFSIRQDDGEFCVGSAISNSHRYPGFLDGQDFWDWWECRKLSMLLYPRIFSLASSPPTVENLQMMRNIYELMADRKHRFQNISCKGCVNSSSSHCMDCVRSKTLRDFWKGKSPGKRFLFE